ncbi:LysR family transcriptional regulator [Geodermatophilus chilensis]|uniref:LysR family transcriptional regulator n=1 Tax=Geodermatophilus chilensis TaxID=2035835 RepID=UPI000C25C831
MRIDTLGALIGRDVLELRQLAYFVAVAEELHFGRAAQRLLLAQPSLSRQIRQLEDELGVTLLERTSRRVELTVGGRTFLDHAVATLAQVEEARVAARRAASGLAGQVRLGFVASVAVAVLPDLVAAHRRSRPQVTLDLREMTTEAQVPALVEGRIDVGLARDLEPVPGLRLQTVARERLLVTMPAHHSLHSRRKLHFAELREEPFVTLPRDQVPRAWDRLWMLSRRAGFAPRIAQEALQYTTMLALVAADIGVAVVPESVRSLRTSGVKYVPIDDSDAESVILAVSRVDERNPAVPGFLNLMDRDSLLETRT